MKNKIGAKNQIKKIIFKFLDPKKHQAFIFGSRVSGRAKKFSDYDIGILGRKPVAFNILTEIEESLEESDIPYKVDVVDFSLVSPQFKKAALSKTEKL